ncbi:MAG: hypothetical protein AB7I27_09180 [Bacteriovoracaceae bacterium]
MLNLKSTLTTKLNLHALILASLILLVSCLPETKTAQINSTNSTGTDSTSTANNYQEPTYPISSIFYQEGSTQSATTFSLPLNFSDSFLIRGKSLSVYLRTLPNTTKYCLVGKYNYSGTDKFLILTAKSKSYTDLVNKTTEFYLQVEPANDTANQNDCLTYNLTNSLFTNATSPTASFSLTQLCSNCSTSVTSTGLKLYFVNGQEVPTLSLSSLIMTISGSTSTTGNTCSESTSCKARGYDCCLQSQCVSDGAVRPGALTSAGFEAAQEDVRLNPTRFLVYPQFYYVCNSAPDTTGSSGQSSVDPVYESYVRMLEMTQLYQCLNKVDGEFSYCTVKFTEASKSIPGNFSASTYGYYDDINFSTVNSNLASGNYANNIVKVIYGGKILYELNSTSLTDASFVAATSNDSTSSAQSINITSSLPTNAKDDNLYLTYKVDGTCEKMGTSLAKCVKTFVQDSSDTYATTYHDSSKTFYLPSYADMTTSVIVKVSGIVVPEDSTTWTKYSSPNRIVFDNSYAIYTNQNVEITYFVTSNVSALLSMKTAAQTQANSICNCASSVKCNLKPAYDSNNNLINYECVYPTPTVTIPVNQTVYVSNKNVPHRYYDLNGVNYDENYSSAPTQEGVALTYTNNNVLKPSNVSTYTGLNEIYGSFAKSGSFVAYPAKLIKVKKDTTYDIYVNSGSFSSCLTCGADYYTSLQRIFPQNFSGKGGGYAPDNYESKRENNASIYRSDDLLYGRACFVPATMIPWSHVAASTPKDQRQSRLSAQHFLFANGYNRDWYGFDYGSLIGSFDGVTWFSIGNSRRIKMKTGKLFLAVNAYYGDLSVDSNFNVTVSESSAYSSDVPDHDTETDGAQCQQSHFCSNDNDCFRQLGYDYTCQNVTSITTAWPQFDSNGTEVVGSVTKTLVSIVGGTNGQSKRCVYRGRGAPCLNDLSLASGTTFNGSSLIGTLSCSPNNTCASLSGSTFNDRIARFANTPLAQNLASAASTTSDLVGLGARIIGRPFNYYGSTSVPSTALSTLSSNSVSAVCVPGKDISNSTTNFDLNSKMPASRTETSDKILGVGPTMSGSQSTKYLNACPATDAYGISMQQYDVSLGDATLNLYTINQNLSSNLLDLTPLTSLNLFSSTAGSQVTSIGYQRNTCLRAPGASCFSDMECAPSNFIASRAQTADLSSLLNSAEEKFWEEGLVCGNSDFKYLQSGVLNPSFDLKKNVCCREYGKTFTVYTQTDSSDYEWCDTATNEIKVAGVNTPINSSSRYSRVHTAYDKMTCDITQISSTKTFALSIESTTAVNRMKQILNQFKTLDTVNQRTCCTQHWVRSFASENGGGHKFDKTKLQSIDKEMFKHISWLPDDETLGVNDGAFVCDPNNYTNSSCEIKTLSASEEEKYLNWAASLELIGIPQVAIKTNDDIYKLVDDNQATPATNDPLDNSIKDVGVVGEDFTDSSGKRYFSAASYSKFEMGTGQLRKVFSENEFNCCVPTGKEVPDSVTSEQCCTGYVANVGGPRRCCLPDYTDVSLYLNRYVSSEGRGLPDSAYDSTTGYIKDPGQVQLLVAQKNLCCSGRAVLGVAISKLPIPLTGSTYLPPSSLNTTRRFTYIDGTIDNNTETGSVGSIFEAGVRWNNHVYCVPSDFGSN